MDSQITQRHRRLQLKLTKNERNAVNPNTVKTTLIGHRCRLLYTSKRMHSPDGATRADIRIR